MKVILNGSPEDLEEGATVEGVVARVVPGDPSLGVAVALNGEVIPKTEWAKHLLVESDRIEVLRAIGGG